MNQLHSLQFFKVIAKKRKKQMIVKKVGRAPPAPPPESAYDLCDILNSYSCNVKKNSNPFFTCLHLKMILLIQI